MHADRHPPTAFTLLQWHAVRDTLYAAGAPFKDQLAHPRCALYRAALAMKLTQENYQHQLSSVGQQGGRLFPERVCFVLLGRCEIVDE